GSIRMGSSGVLGYIERADRRVCGKSRASREVVRHPSLGRGADPDAVPLGGQSREASEVARGNCRIKVLAFLAPLVSTSVFSVLFWGTRKTCSPGDARLAGRQVDRV